MGPHQQVKSAETKKIICQTIVAQVIDFMIEQKF